MIRVRSNASLLHWHLMYCCHTGYCHQLRILFHFFFSLFSYFPFLFPFSPFPPLSIFPVSLPYPSFSTSSFPFPPFSPRKRGRHSAMPTYRRENAWFVTAFNSTDIRSVQDNVATPVTAMMVTVCVSTDALSSVFISPDLSDTNSFHQCCWSIMPVTACCTDGNSLFPTYLYHSVTSDCYSPDNPTDCSSLIRQFWTVCRRQQSDTAMISYLYQAWRCNRL